MLEAKCDRPDDPLRARSASSIHGADTRAGRVQAEGQRNLALLSFYAMLDTDQLLDEINDNPPGSPRNIAALTELSSRGGGAV
jgi:hypothetical protein